MMYEFKPNFDYIISIDQVINLFSLTMLFDGDALNLDHVRLQLHLCFAHFDRHRAWRERKNEKE